MAAPSRNSPNRLTLALLLAGGLLVGMRPLCAAQDKPASKPAQAGKPPAHQTIKLGNVGEKARVEIKQIQGVDPKELAKVLDMLNKRDADARKHEQRAAELEKELEKARSGAVRRVLAEAAKPQASDLAERAREALLKGDTALAEKLLRQQEAQVAGAAEEKRREAAKLAREIAALAIGRDSKAALAALKRAANYAPEDFWTHIQLGDAQAVLGQSTAAMTSYYKAAQTIAEALAARDPANTDWQRDLIVSNVKLGKATGDKAYVRNALKIAESMRARNILAPRDAWMIEELRRRAGP